MGRALAPPLAFGQQFLPEPFAQVQRQGVAQIGMAGHGVERFGAISEWRGDQ